MGLPSGPKVTYMGVATVCPAALTLVCMKQAVDAASGAGAGAGATATTDTTGCKAIGAGAGMAIGTMG